MLRYLTSSGELRWAEVRLCRQAQGFLASLADVSAQIPQGQRLQASHRSLTNLLDGLSAASGAPQGSASTHSGSDSVLA